MTTELINKGKHRAIVRNIQFGLAGKDDKQQAVVGFEILGDTIDSGRLITAFLFFTDATFDRTIESLRHCGWVGEALDELPDLAASGQLNQEVEIVVDHEEWDGAWLPKIKWINKVGGSGITLKKPLEGDELKRFAAQMKGRVRASSPKPASRPSNGATPKPVEAQTSTPGSTDDIPF